MEAKADAKLHHFRRFSKQNHIYFGGKFHAKKDAPESQAHPLFSLFRPFAQRYLKLS
jgi:hypothetical protein